MNEEDERREEIGRGGVEGEGEEDFGGMFQEPSDFRPPPPLPTNHAIQRDPQFVKPGTPSEFKVELVGHHGLWAHCLWNAGVYFSKYLDENNHICEGKRILELGAAAALPSMTCVCNNAKNVVITDYPDRELIDMIKRNVKENLSEDKTKDVVSIQGYLWGNDVGPLLEPLGENNKFDVIIMADLLANHSEHSKMLKTCQNALEKSGEIFVIFSAHRPWLLEKDMNIFKLAAEEPFNFKVEKIFTTNMPPMFPNDPGDEIVRSTIHGYRMTFCN